MAIERDKLRITFLNNNDIYSKILKDRYVPFIAHYGSKRFQYPTTEQMSSFSVQHHTWTTGDRFWKLASSYYDDPAAWWVIGWFNQKPTEAHVQTGNLIMIPGPLEVVYQFLGI